MEFRKSERKKAKIKIGLQGPSGSGKTYSALLLAKGITNDWSKVVVIDTENNSADLYASLGEFNVINLAPPFTPEKYIDAIKLAKTHGMEVIIIDSISHEWDGIGGILDIHANIPGNSFTNWSKVTPRHNAFIQAVLQTPCHFICTMRSKQDYVLSDRNGKMVPEKVGLKSVTRDGTDYEFTLVFELDSKNNASASKDRTNLFFSKPAFKINEETGTIINNWCNKGTSENEVRNKIVESASLEELIGLYHQYPEYHTSLKQDFIKQKQILNNHE
jgi:hypothetical protein